MEKPGVLKNDMGNGKAHGKKVLEQTTQKIRDFVISAWKCLIKITAAAAAKSLQSCLTLCDPIDGSPPGSSVPGTLQARALEWVPCASGD